MTIEAPVRPRAEIEAAWRVEVLDPTAAEESWIDNDVRYQWLGEAWQAGLNLMNGTALTRFRVMRTHDPDPWADSDCESCPEAMKGGMFPMHHINRACRSGKRPHCTCDGCF